MITFSNLFPSAVFPNHGLFVRERMRRVLARMDCDWQVVAAYPVVPWPLKRKLDRAYDAMPGLEEVSRGGSGARLGDQNGDPSQTDAPTVTVHHPRYWHLPGLSVAAQARRMAKAALPVVRRLAAEGPCVLDAHYVYPDGVAALLIAEQLDIPCVVTARGTDLNVLAENGRVAAQIQSVAGGAHRLLAVSEALRERFVAVAKVSDDRVQLVRNGVDLERFHPGDVGRARQQFELPSDALLVLSVGRIVSGKGFHLVAKALASMPEKVHMVVVGDGPDRARLEQLLPPGRLHLLGPRSPEETAEVYRACDLFALPSEREGWPNVVTEALASGLPVVATAVGAVPDMLTSPQIGTLVRTGDHKALGSAIKRMLQMTSERQRIHAFARRFSWDEPVEQVVEIFAAVLG